MEWKVLITQTEVRKVTVEAHDPEEAKRKALLSDDWQIVKVHTDLDPVAMGS